MVQLIQIIYSLFAFITLASADVAIMRPSKDSNFIVSGSSVTVEVVWIESSSDPMLSDIESYKFKICTGPNSNINGIKILADVKASDITDYTYDVVIPSSLGADGSYYIQISAATSNGGYSIHYTNRFTLSGMSGTLKPSGGSELGLPAPEVHLDSAATSTLDPAELSSSFALPYTLQTGLTRYAPMQTQPGSKVTASTWTRRFPSSSVTYFTTVSSSPEQKSTVTPGWDYTISSAANFASPAPFPSDNGGWYDPKSKLSRATKRATLTSHTSA